MAYDYYSPILRDSGRTSFSIENRKIQQFRKSFKCFFINLLTRKILWEKSRSKLDGIYNEITLRLAADRDDLYLMLVV